MIDKALSVLNDVVGLFYPTVCGGCDSQLIKQEQNLCLNCLHGLPKTYFWDYEVNPIEKLFWGRLEVGAACAFLHFEKDSALQHLLYRLKYEGKSGIGAELGRLFAHILREKNWFVDVDVIIPIPLHISKEQRRGYNQSAHIANGIGEIFSATVRNRALKRIMASESQTDKSRYSRVQNVENVFEVGNARFIIGKNVLLVDDIITTGATLEAAGNALLQAGARRLYIATIAVA